MENRKETTLVFGGLCRANGKGNANYYNGFISGLVSWIPSGYIKSTPRTCILVLQQSGCAPGAITEAPSDSQERRAGFRV